MTTLAPTRLLGHLHGLAPGGDDDLLARFVTRRDEPAFAALVRRHGPMVLGVCRRVLRQREDAEDAFQATFLVLARKAASVADPAALASWLYGVAYRTALKARSLSRKRRDRETQMPPAPRTDHDPLCWAELESALDRELHGLPEAYRRAIVLCDLEELPRRDAAGRLGVSESALAGHLFRGRRLLAERLRRHKLELSAAALAALLSGGRACARPPQALVEATVGGASAVAAGLPPSGGVSPSALTLTSGVLKAMYARKLLSSATAALTLAAVALLAWVGYTTQAAAPQQPPAQQPKQEQPAADKDDAVPIDVMLLQERKVVRALKCSDEQWDKIDDVLEAAMEKMQNVTINLANGQQPVDIEKGMKDVLADAARTVTTKILTPAQVKRLRQIDLQTQGAHAFTLPRVQAALKLTDKQREQVKDEMDKAQQAIQDMIQNGLNNPVNPGALLDTKALQAHYDVAARNIQKLLTAEQKKLWTDLTGEPLRFNPRRNPMFGNFQFMAPGGALPFGGGGIAGGGIAGGPAKE